MKYMSTPDEVHPGDAEKIFGALQAKFFQKVEHHEQQVLEEPEPTSVEELHSMGFRWGDYTEDCLEYLVEEYDGVEKIDGGYVIRTWGNE